MRSARDGACPATSRCRWRQSDPCRRHAFHGYRAAGFNRVSLGVHALDDASLRRWDACTAPRWRWLRWRSRAAHSSAIRSTDLCPSGPDAGRLGKGMRLAISEAADNLSLYQLTIEPDTPFAGLQAAGKLIIPDEGNARVLYDVTQDICASPGCRPTNSPTMRAPRGMPHNLVYWRGDEYRGVGPGAHGRIDTGGVRRATATEKRPEAWLMRVEQLVPRVTVDDPLPAKTRRRYLLMACACAKVSTPPAIARWPGARSIRTASIRLREQGAIVVDSDGRFASPSRIPGLDAVVADLAA